MTHRAETIMDAVETVLTGLTTTGARVQRTRVRTVETAPALSIEQGGDDVNEDASSFPLRARDLNVKIIAHVENNTAPETQMNLIREEVYNAMLTDNALGLTYITDIELIGDDEPEFTGEGEKISGKQVMNYVVKYRHSWTDAGA